MSNKAYKCNAALQKASVEFFGLMDFGKLSLYKPFGVGSFQQPNTKHYSHTSIISLYLFLKEFAHIESLKM